MYVHNMNLRTRKLLCAAIICCAVAFSGCQQADNQAPSQHSVAISSDSSAPTGAQERATSYAAGAATKSFADCNLEAVNATHFGAQALPLQASDANVFAGWIDAAKLGGPAFWIRFDDQKAGHYFHIPVRLTEKRPDVASTNAGAPLISGFRTSLPAENLPAGTYHVYLVAKVASDAYVCDNGRHVKVEN
jgi:hypothetical protein